jgi:hypothetical protein
MKHCEKMGNAKKLSETVAEDAIYGILGATMTREPTRRSYRVF